MVQIEGDKLSWYEKDSFNIKKRISFGNLHKLSEAKNQGS